MENTNAVESDLTVPASTVIIINAREHKWEQKVINFEEVVKLAFGSISSDSNVVYTVIYKRGPKQNPEGSMVRGDKVFVQSKMIFNATSTDKS